MPRASLFTVMFVVFAASSVATAQPATRPTTAPATRPAGVDLSSPKATLVSLGGAIERGDLDAVAATFADPSAGIVWRRLTPLMTPSYRLDALMRRRFGKGLDAVPNGTALLRADTLDAAQTTRDGDRAKVTLFEVQEFELARQPDGRWLNVTDEDGRVPPDEARQIAEQLVAIAKEEFDPINAAVGEAIRGVESGRLSSRRAVLDELERKVGLPVVGDGK